jgi:hypothetical protein
MNQKILSWFFGFLITTVGALAQDTSQTVTRGEFEEAETSIDGINETIAGIQSTLDALKKIKISGYIQSQYQVAEAVGPVTSVAGGNFPSNVRSRFSVRRGRVKFAYVNDLSQYVLQIDVTQNGVGIKDAYVSILDPWERAFGMTAGIFDRPFGFEIMYSSGLREMPERTRMYQTLFPGERELGAKLEILPQEGPFSWFNLKAGVFNGVTNTANENNRVKDFIGRAGFQLPFTEENLEVDGGFSVYSGKVTSTSKYIYTVDESASPVRYQVDSSGSNLNSNHERTYYGGDLQLYYDLPVVGGLSLRGEYITGDQPGTSVASGFYNPYSASGALDVAASLYKRQFAGWYIAYVQNVGSMFQFVARYDEYDPNTAVEGSDIGATGSNLTIADVGYTTLGLGWLYHFDSNIKFTLYYDIVNNEKVSPSATGTLAAFKDDLNDNVLTFRMQFRF